MITSHGNPKPGVRLWRYEVSGIDRQPKFEHIVDMNGHDGGRVLGLHQNPDGAYVMSFGDDDTIRIWDCWKVDESVKEATFGGSSNVRKKLTLINSQNIIR